MIHRLHMPFCIVLSLAISACSNIHSVKSPTSCGKQIQPADVVVLDLRPIGDQPDLIADFIAEKVGAYQLITTQPIGVPVGGARCSSLDCLEEDTAINGVKGTSKARDEAAMRGCNLVLALELKVVPPKGGGYSISPSSGRPAGNWVWVVHLGMLE